MKIHKNISIAVSSFVLLAAKTNGVTEVLREDSLSRWIGMLALLTSVTAITFILVLLACGMKEPII